MGVPKFYRWLSERYPCLSEVVKEYQIPEFDNLYLDMNGIIHICSHPNDDDPHFRITQEKIFLDIFHYIEWLFRLIKPRKVFFMAVDGVAPRAKMNQQRGRRFRTAREATEADAKARERGETLPTEERFDSNCITPGTEFMVRLHEQLKYFVNMKISSDKLWQGPRIYLSGHETPGEGEHKIMDFIRHERSQAGYDPNTRHCLYGLDADLIMLGLCTHDPHFSLLREEIRYTGKKSQKRIPTPEETTYHLLHLSLLREYLEHEFSSVRDLLPFPYDMESIVDDWVLMGFLVGNDFIPNLPHLHIVHGALPTLYKTYIDVLPTLDGYINEKGSLNLGRFQKYMEKLAETDYENFNEQYADLKWLESKKGSNGFVSRKGNKGRHQHNKGQHRRQKKAAVAAANKNQFEVIAAIDEEFPFFDASSDVVPVGKLIDFSDGEGGGGVDCEDEVDDDKDEEEETEDSGDGDLFSVEFRNHKRVYYMEKLEYQKVTGDVLREQAECFVRAIQWNLHYYYDGVCSWSWYYPHHYAPYISDIRGFANMTLRFDYGTPFHAFEQLLAVLPAASKKLLPVPYQSLMCDPASPLIDYYPVDFTTDLNGKQQDWEAVVQIPFIDEKRLLTAMDPLNDKLTPDEKNRNTHGPCLLYTYSEESLGSYPSTLKGHLPDLAHTHARCTHIGLEGFRVERDKLRKGLCEGIRLDVHFPGFPSLKHIEHTAKLKKAEVKVFQMISRGENMILKIEKGLDMDIKLAAETLLDSTVYVGWPHLIEAKVVAVSDPKHRFTLGSAANDGGDRAKVSVQRADMVKDEGEVWRMQRDTTQETYFNRWGVEIGETKAMVFVVPLIGRKYICASGSKVTLVKMWASTSVPYAMQTIVKDIEVHDSSFQQYQTLEELFPVDSVSFLTTTPNYGCLCHTMEVCTKRKGYVQVRVDALEEPDLDRIQQLRATAASGYMPGYLVAQKLGISGLLLSRITGTLYIKGGAKGHPATNQKHSNIGLNLKFNKKNEEAFGFAKKIGDSWTYSYKTVEVMEQYLQRFPELFDYLQTKMREDNYYEDDIVAGCFGKFAFKDIIAFLKCLPSYTAVHQPCGSETIEADAVKEIEEAVDKIADGPSKMVIMQVKARCLYRPNYTQGCSLPDPSATYQLLDRVVNIRNGYSVPLGLRGTIIGIQSAEKEADVVYQIVFDKEFSGGITIRCSPHRGYFLPSYALINLSHGYRLEHSHNKPTAVVHPQYAKPGNRIVVDNSSVNKSFGDGGATKNGRNNEKANNNRRQNNNSNSTGASSVAATSGFSVQHQHHHQGQSDSPHEGATHGNYPNTLNHSPNSPFIARQPQLLRNRPQFVTPKMPTPNYQVSPRQQPGSQKQFAQSQETEFQEIWKNLLRTVKTTDSAGVEQTNAIPALKLAAKSLPKEQIHSDSVTEAPPRQGPPPMPAFGQRSTDTSVRSSGGASSEFSSMFLALESQSKVGQSTATEPDVDSLSGLLQRLGGIVDLSASTEATPSSAHRYSKQISVEQLFKETRESEIKSAHGNKLPTDSALTVSTRENYAAPVITNHVTALMNIVQEQFGGVPTYEYKHVGPMQSVTAKVTLPDGSVHYGAVSTNNQTAAQSAANQAIINISKDSASRNPTNPGSRAPSGGFVPRPTMSTAAVHRTGAPVRMNFTQPAMLQGTGRPLMHPHMYPPCPQPAYPGAYLAQRQGAYMMAPPPVMPPAYYSMQPPYGAPQHSRMSHAAGWGRDNWQGQHLQQQRPSADHPFVPLQVTRQKMQPRKYSSSESTDRGSEAETSDQPRGDHRERVTAQPGTSSDMSTGEPNWRNRSIGPASSADGKASSHQSGGQQASSHQRRKRGSRLAINFGAKPKQ